MTSKKNIIDSTSRFISMELLTKTWPKVKRIMADESRKKTNLKTIMKHPGKFIIQNLNQ